MKFFSKDEKQRFPQVNAYAGCAHVPASEELARDETLGVQLDAPALPDFDGIASELVASAGSCPSFHQSGIGQYPGKLARSFEKYVFDVDEAAYRLGVELDTTYRSSLTAAIEVCESRIAQISPPPAKASNKKQGKRGKAVPPLEGAHHES